MDEIRAFVGHSFNEADKPVVDNFLRFLTQIEGVLPTFSWVHAVEAEPVELRTKVLSLIEGKNTFIAICTRSERVIETSALSSMFFNRHLLKAPADKFKWKTSDWIIQEIGLAIGRGMSVIILLEEGCKQPGGLQGNLEYISFNRDRVGDACGRILEMLKALSPSPARAGATTEGLSSGAKSDAEAVPESDDLTPGVEWDVERYRRAGYICFLTGDVDKFTAIQQAYLSTPHGQQRENAAIWESKAEYYRIIFETGVGSIEKLRSLASEFPTNSEIVSDLATALGVFQHHVEAAEIFERASEVADDPMLRVVMLGRSAVQYAKAGRDAKALAQIAKQKSMTGSDLSAAKKVLLTIKRVAEANKNDALEIEALEREVELAPDDVEARFQLAYRHGEFGNQDLSLHHYLKIPFASRSAITWNNLGASYQHFRVQGRSVDAYRRAANRGETLAMSNLAYKLMHAGFVEEAKAEAMKAMAINGHHRNVEAVLAELSQFDEKETTSVDEVLNKAKSKASFYAKLGEAILARDAFGLTANWRGPVCELSIAISGNIFTAKGCYEHSNSNALMGLLPGLGGLGASSSLPVCTYIEYKGAIIGDRVEGTIKRWDEPERARSLLSGFGDDGKFLMVLSREKIEVMESPTNSSPTFYQLEPI